MIYSKNNMKAFERFAIMLGYCSGVIFLLIVLSSGLFLTLMSLAVALVGYYPITFCSWVASKFNKGE